MPPTPKYTKDEIVLAAYELVKEGGYDALTARDLGAKLGTSARPIFTAFENMEQLKSEVVKKARQTFADYQKAEIALNLYPEYKAIGMAYIRLAKEEKNIFKLLFMRDRSGENIADDDLAYSYAPKMAEKTTGLSTDDAERFHAEMWIVVHGLATMVATSYLDLEFDKISEIISHIFASLKRSYTE